ncbi:MAG: diadenylate cyclase CdaA [Pseudomonadota bacterium]
MDILSTIFKGFRWQDIADIALNSYILFRLYALFRGTNVFRIITGIVLLWILQQVAVWLGLIVTSWVLQGIIAVAALIIIVVFRNEIRSVLQAQNLRAILWGTPFRLASAPTEDIVDAVFSLARQSIGALMVLQVKESLDDVAQGGVTLGAQLSSELLASLFWTGAPLHDGAVIINGDRIERAGVILPLSQDNDMPQEYGTRHRAAIGLSEMTDALVIVVSEERGEVGVAVGGQIYEAPDRTVLSQLLMAHGIGAATSGQRETAETIRMGFSAVFSIVVVAMVWFTFSRGLESIVTVDAPIEYIKRNPDVEIIKASINTVSLSLGGSGPLLRNLHPDQVKVRLDLGGASAGVNAISVTSDNISLPPGVVLKHVQPDVVEVTIDQPVEKELPIQIDWGGTLPPDVMITGATVAPPTSRVKGGYQLLQQVQTLYTEKIILDRLDPSGTVIAKLVPYPASVRVAPGAPDRVEIQFTVAPREGGDNGADTAGDSPDR